MAYLFLLLFWCKVMLFLQTDQINPLPPSPNFMLKNLNPSLMMFYFVSNQYIVAKIIVFAFGVSFGSSWERFQ